MEKWNQVFLGLWLRRACSRLHLIQGNWRMRYLHRANQSRKYTRKCYAMLPPIPRRLPLEMAI